MQNMSGYPGEDNLIERKVESDTKDLLKTLVAFANSVKPGQTATLLIGEMNDGTVQGVTNSDSMQKRVNRLCKEEIYPPLVEYSCYGYQKDGKTCVRVEIQHDGNTPRFGGPAWVRKGSETIVASPEMFQKLIEFRNSKLWQLREWIGKEVSSRGETGNALVRQRIYGVPITLVEISAHYIVVNDRGDIHSELLDNVTISWDPQQRRLRLVIKEV